MAKHYDVAVLGAGVGALAAAAPTVRLLVKGSRFNRLERVVDALSGVPGGGGGH